MPNLLRNPNFDNLPDGKEAHVYTPNGSYVAERGEVDNVEGWRTWYWHEREFVPPWDPDNREGYCEPECRPNQYPERFVKGDAAYMMFVRWRIMKGGMYQRVFVGAGNRVRFSFFSHAWSSNDDFSDTSEGCGNAAYYAVKGSVPPGPDYDALTNVTFKAGIDPTGDIDPTSVGVVWAEGAHIYNRHHAVPYVEVVAQGDYVTVFTYGKNMWRFSHIDLYYDSAVLEVVSDPSPTPDYEGPVKTHGSKLGTHDSGGVSAGIVTALASAGGYVATVKAFESVGFLSQIKSNSPLTVTVARFSAGASGTNWEQPPLDGDLRALAQQIINDFVPKWEPHKDYVDYFEVVNELDPPGEDGHTRLANLMIYLMEFAEVAGYKLALFSYSMGVPEWEEWAAIVNTGVFAIAKAGGHILALHEYAYPIDVWFGDPLPGRPAYPDRGPLACRYRWLYEDFLKPRGEVVGLVISEFNIARDLDDVSVEEWIRSVVWYDARLREDYYVIGAHLFAIGTGGAWSAYDYAKWLVDLQRYMLVVTDDENALPPGLIEPPPLPGVCPAPRENFHCVYALIPPDHGWEWFAALQGEWEKHRFTIGGSADHAAYIPGVTLRTVLTLNPNAWGDLAAFFDQYYPTTEGERLEYVPIYADTPADWAAGIARYYNPELPEPPIILDVRDQLATNPASPWYPWRRRTWAEITHVFVHHSAGDVSSALATVKAIAVYHASPTGKNRPGICYSYVIGADGTIWYVSDIENVVFSQGSVDYPGDENRFGVGVCLLGSFIDGREPTAEQMASLERLIGYLEREVGHSLDVWGHTDVSNTQCPGDSWPFKPEWGRTDVPEPPPPPPPPPTPAHTWIGFNDFEGAHGSGSSWMRSNGVQGLVVRPIDMTGDGAALDFSVAEAAGQRVIVNPRYTWANMAGTIPVPNTTAWVRFVEATARTMRLSRGVWAWFMFNEANNRRESPPEHLLTPADIVVTYNAIRELAPGIRMSPGALDPYNGELGDPRDWLYEIYNGISGAEAIDVHGYVRGPIPENVGSTAKFTDDPLRWQYLNFPLCCTELLKSLPAQYRGLPWYVSETNHLYKTAEPDWGWVQDQRAGVIVERLFSAAQSCGCAGLALYRWDADQWACYDNPWVLDAVKRIA